MQKIYALLCCSLLIPFLSNAQSNYKPGYVVTLKGDTLRGFIDYREWDANPDAVNFKSALTDQKGISYKPDNIDYFSIDNLESFIRYNGPISMDPTSMDKVAYGRDTSFRTAAVFLKVMEKGQKLALYSYKDDIKARYYIGESPNYVPKELIFKVYNDPNFTANHDPNASRVVSENTYQKQLSAAAYRCNELSDNVKVLIGRSEYSGDNIFDIVSKINHITKKDYKKNHYSGPSVNLFVGAGVNINTTSPAPGGSFYKAGGGSHTSYMPAILFWPEFFFAEPGHSGNCNSG